MQPIAAHWLLRKKTLADHQEAVMRPGVHHLKKTLGAADLTAFGVAAIIGAGVFSTIGNAAASGGPAVVFLFIFTGICCAFSAMCYAQFASAIPGAGSAYTYAYTSFGEIIAWIIGWDLLMEYSIGNIAVSISWSGYFASLLEGYGIHIPHHLTMDFLSAKRAYAEVMALGPLHGQLSDALQKGYEAWTSAPRLFGLPIICNLPAFGITALITAVIYIGIEESRIVANSMVILKVLIVLLVVAVGGFYINPEHWVPFNPHGASGVMKGVAAVFFAYIGFDAISTAAEECKDPQRDLPKGMIYSLAICTVLYVLVALVLTGVVDHSKLGVEDPLAFVFGPEGANVPWVHWIVSVGAIIALASVLLIFQLGQPRIWMAMSRDGLLPPIFASIHPKYKTPWFATLLTGVFVSLPALFMNLTEVTELTSIGTLFAFVLVCGGVLKLQGSAEEANSLFRIPYINSKYFFPALVVIGLSVTGWQIVGETLDWQAWFLRGVYAFAMVGLAILCFLKNFSLIPVLGLASCSYLMCELGITNWIRFGMWLLVGLTVYFLYGVRHSRLAGKASFPRT